MKKLESWQKRRGLVKRFSKRQAARAKQINNDIAEFTNYENHTKAELRMAVAYYADHLAVSRSDLVGLQSHVVVHGFEASMKKVLGDIKKP